VARHACACKGRSLLPPRAGTSQSARGRASPPAQPGECWSQPATCRLGVWRRGGCSVSRQRHDFRANDTMGGIGACAREPPAANRERRVPLLRERTRGAQSLQPCAAGDVAWSVYMQLAYPPTFRDPGAISSGGAVEEAGFAACLGCWAATKASHRSSVKGSRMA
jgi:hypothetical protein